MEGCFLAVDKRYFALCRREELHLKSQDILILAQVEEFWRSGRPCWLTNRTLAENIGESESTVKRSLDRLCALGFISRETTVRHNVRQRLLHFCAEKVYPLAGPPVQPAQSAAPVSDTLGMNPPQSTAPSGGVREPYPPQGIAPNRYTYGSNPTGAGGITTLPPVQNEPTKDNLQDNPKEKTDFAGVFNVDINVPFYAKRLLDTLETKHKAEQEAGENGRKREYGLPGFGRIL